MLVLTPCFLEGFPPFAAGSELGSSDRSIFSRNSTSRGFIFGEEIPFTAKISDWSSPKRFAKRKINPAVFLRGMMALRLSIEKQCIFVNICHFIRDFPYVHLAFTG
jgi:hypothetical protein